METIKKLALITGATSGIGEASAIKFAENNYNLILTGRRDDRLQKLKKHLVSVYHCEVQTLSFDVRDNNAVIKKFNSLADEWRNIDVLINNAGLSVGLEPIHEGMIDDWERMIDTNVKGLLYVSRAIIPWMVERKQGHVINIGSIAGKEIYPGGNVYCATKYAVDALSKAMRMDLVKHNIKVSQICPGAADTEFSLVRFKGNKEKADNVYQGFTPLYAKDIAETIYYVTTLPPHVNINDLVMTATAQASVAIIDRK